MEAVSDRLPQRWSMTRRALQLLAVPSLPRSCADLIPRACEQQWRFLSIGPHHLCDTVTRRLVQLCLEFAHGRHGERQRQGEARREWQRRRRGERSERAWRRNDAQCLNRWQCS